jgi:hypothetical protein
VFKKNFAYRVIVLDSGYRGSAGAANAAKRGFADLSFKKIRVYGAGSCPQKRQPRCISKEDDGVPEKMEYQQRRRWPTSNEDDYVET